ncbi:uncharacterized protein LOC123608407 [Leopardus geoffroyi]|uniref:uncharacterized protein LOC115513969 n=1 Tax=Lynx canadensis TaxID=61383 RepID=UPI0011B01094|nr:uncharacterized protein LOC115513969 [Lynx canadensis]XP_045354244.1 uncharacterized protein LOC123608407 [Leopardus geoffroyi]
MLGRRARRPSASPGGQGLLAAAETAGGGGRDHALAAEGSPDPSPHIKRYNVSFYGEAAPYMVSPCAPAALVRGSGTSAPHWPTGSAYLHRHTELAAVIPRQTATPKGEEPTPLKGTGEEATTLSHQAGSPVLIHHPLYWRDLWQTYIWKRPGGDSRPPSPRRGQGDEMKISEDFQLRAGLGEGVVPGIKPTLPPVQRPGKK